MRIGIIAMARSGGHNLGEWIAGEKECEFIHEPFLNNIVIDNRNNIVIKFLLSEWFQLNEKPKLDKLIGLVRTDYREGAISFVRAMKTNEWHKPYKLNEEWIGENEEEIQTAIEWLRRDDLKLQSEIPEIEIIVSYEGIYNKGNDIKRITNYLQIENPKYLHMLNPSNRLRNKSIKEIKTLI